MKIAFDKAKIRRIVRSKAFMITVAVILVYTLTGFFLTPLLIRHYVPRTIQEKLHKDTYLGKVRFNPYLFKLELRSFRIIEPDGKAIIAFDRLFTDWEVKSLFKWAWVFREIRLEEPMVHAAIEKEGGLNLANLGSSSKAEQPGKQPEGQSGKQPPRLIFENIRIIKGKLIFSDQRPTKPATITLAPLDAAFINLATLADRESGTTLTAVSQNQETLKWVGQVGLNPLTVKGHLNLQNVRSATLIAFAGDALRLGPSDGSLTAEGDCLIEIRQEISRIVFSKLSLLLKDVGLASADAPGKPFLKLPDARMAGAQLDVTDRKIHLGSIVIKGGNAHIAMDEKGVLNLQRIAVSPEKGPEKDKPPAAEKQSDKEWAFSLGGLELEGFAALYEDSRRRPEFKGSIAGIGARLAAETGTDGALLVKDVLLRLSDVRVGLADAEPAVRIGSVALEKGNADLGKKHLKAAKVAIEGGAIQIERGRDGSLNLARLFAPTRENTAPTKPEAGEAKPPAFQFLVDRMSLSGIQATIWDRTVREDQPVLHVDDLSAGAAQVDGRSPMPLELAIKLREGGELNASGTLDPGAGSLTAQIEMTALTLATFQPYVAPVAAIVVKSGHFSTTGALRHGIQDAAAKTIYEGGFKIEDLRVVETDIDETLIGWKMASTEQLKLSLQPNALEIGDLRIEDLGGKAIVEKDGSFNLANLIKKDESSAKNEKTEAEPAAEAEPFAYRVRRVLVNDGRIIFADRRLRIPFATTIHELRGNVAGISSVKDARSELRLRGRVDEFGTARAEGELNTADPKKFADIKLAFRNVEMSKLTPYSGQFAGRKIDAGKLTVDLAYQVDNAQLKGDNKIVVDQLKLGEKVKSPDAVDLPLDLAVALLKNSKGVIDLGLPVQGDLNNPQFSIGALVGKTLVNVLKKVATSPFRALGALIPGGGEETLDRVAFDPGRANVPPPEREKLLKLAEAMAQRPQLKLVIQGRYHPEKDRLSLARRSLRKTVTVRLGQTVSEDGPNPLDFSSSETQDVLEELFEERFGEDALEALEDELKGARKQAKENDPGFWAKELFNRLLAVEPVPDERLVELAQARAQEVLKELSAAPNLSSERFGTQAPTALKASEEVAVALSMEARE